jgi:hypothetical protein
VCRVARWGRLSAQLLLVLSAITLVLCSGAVSSLTDAVVMSFVAVEVATRLVTHALLAQLKDSQPTIPLPGVRGREAAAAARQGARNRLADGGDDAGAGADADVDGGPEAELERWIGRMVGTQLSGYAGLLSNALTALSVLRECIDDFCLLMCATVLTAAVRMIVAAF